MLFLQFILTILNQRTKPQHLLTCLYYNIMIKLQNEKITIGDRVKVLWTFDNQYHSGRVVDISDNIITITAPSNKVLVPNHRISITDKKRIFKFND